MASFASILVATDFSEPARQALDCAVDLSRELRARLTVLHVYEAPFGAQLGVAPATLAALGAEVATAAQKALDELLSPYRARGLVDEGVLRTGAAWSQINAFALERKADIVVLGTHGRSGLVRALMGSVAEKVVRTCSLPVLTVRARGSEDTASEPAAAARPSGETV